TPFDVLQERGESQVEVALRPYDRMAELLAHIQQAKKIIREVAARHDRLPRFEAKPFPEIPGNGFHVHVSLVDHTGLNRFFKRNEEITPELSHALGGLIAAMPESMCVFAPQEISYQRFTGKEPEAPSTISWG